MKKIVVAACLVAAACAPVSRPTPRTGPEPSAASIAAYLDARSLEAAGEIGEAEAAFRAAIAADSSAELALEHARFLRQLGKMPESQAEAERAIRTDPNLRAARRFLGETRQILGRGDEKAATLAVQDLEAGLVLDEGRWFELTVYADASLAMADVDRAERAIAALNMREGEVPTDLRFRLAQLLFEKGRLERADELFRELTLEQPRDPRPALYRVEILERQGEFREAADLLEPITRLRPENHRLRARLAYLLLRTGRASEAIDRLEGLLRVDSDAPLVKETLAMAYREVGRHDDARKLYAELVALRPDDVELAFKEATNLSASLDHDAARVAWARLLTRAEKSGDDDLRRAVLLERGLLEWAERNADAALELVEPLVAEGGGLGLALDVLRVQGQIDAARVLIDRARARDPEAIGARILDAQFAALDGDEWPARQLLCELEAGANRDRLLAALDLLQRLKWWGDAVRISEQLVVARPDDPVALFRLASNLERAGRLSESESAFERLLRVAPDHAPGLNYFGYMLADAGRRLGDAESFIHRAIALDPANPAYLDSLGWVQYRQNRLQEAEAPLLRAAELAPGDWNIREHVGDLYRALGRMDDAISSWERAFELQSTADDADPADVESLRRKIEALRRP